MQANEHGLTAEYLALQQISGHNMTMLQISGKFLINESFQFGNFIFGLFSLFIFIIIQRTKHRYRRCCYAYRFKVLNITVPLNDWKLQKCENIIKLLIFYIEWL